MSSLKVILESHPIKSLNDVIKEVKSELSPDDVNLLSLSKAKKRHSKATLIEHILKLDKMGLLKKRPSMYEKPVRAKKEPKKATAKEIKDSLMVPGKYTKKELKEGKALVKNQPKKEPKKAKAKQKIPEGFTALPTLGSKRVVKVSAKIKKANEIARKKEQKQKADDEKREKEAKKLISKAVKLLKDKPQHKALLDTIKSSNNTDFIKAKLKEV